MRHSQTIEGSYGRARTLLTPVVAATLGGALLAGGCTEQESGGTSRTPDQHAPTVTAAAQAVVGNTVTGRVETLQGEPVRVRSNPFGPEIGEYRDGSMVQVLCSAPGPDAPGDPRDFGKTPYADTTWLQLASPDSGQPFSPPRYIPLNPVFFEPGSAPVPACPR